MGKKKKNWRYKLIESLSGTLFEKKVWQALCQIPRGDVWTYSQLAEKIDCPRAARPVGNALAKNPLPIVIPCHRVIRCNGDIGNYSFFLGGTKIKKLLLWIERKDQKGK